MSLPSASLEQLRTAIVATITSVADVGAVHPYIRHDPDPEVLRGLYEITVGAGQVVRGWHVARATTYGTLINSARVLIDHDWVITGLWELNDGAGSAVAFDEMIEAVCAAFRADRWLSDLVFTVPDAARFGLCVDDVSTLTFAGVLCHCAHLSLRTRVCADLEPPEDDVPYPTEVLVGCAPEIGAEHADAYVAVEPWGDDDV
jgi:hypothetical protein